MSTRSLVSPLILAALLAGCSDSDPDDPDTDAADDDARMQAICARCHVLPPSDALPRAVWPRVIDNMLAVPVPEGQAPLTRQEIDFAKTYYAARAPERLAVVPPADRSGAGPSFAVERLTPPGLEELRLPAVASVRLVPFSDPRRPDLVACELRSGSLLRLAAAAPPGARALLPALRGLDSPARVEIADLGGARNAGDRDSGPPSDILIAGLGSIDPTNDRVGSVLLFRREGGRHVRHEAARGLGRVADVDAADLDGDGDLDLVACAFGWLGPGELLVLEDRTAPEPGAPPRFAPRVLDDRDGFVEAATVDLDGDGRVDLVALLSQEHEEVVAFLNRGDLRFERVLLHKAPHAGWGYAGLELVDLDGDGDLDLLTANGDSLDFDPLKPYHGVEWLENRGGLEFRREPIAALHGCNRAVAGDVDGDGDLDVVAAAFLPLLRPAEWRERDLDSIIWVERRPDGWRAHALERHRPIHPALALGDLDGDGRLDIAAGNYVWIDEHEGPRTRAEYVTVFLAR